MGDETQQGREGPNRRSILRTNRRSPSHPGAFIHFEHERKHFIMRVYSLGIIFICMSTIQWLIVLINDDVKDFLMENHTLSFISAIMMLVFYTFFVIFSDLRYNDRINWILGIIIVEFATFGFIQTYLYRSLDLILLYYLITIALFVGISTIAVLLPLDLTLAIVPFIIISVLVYLTITVLIVLAVTSDIFISDWLLFSLILTLVIMFVMYDAQLISGSRAGILRWNDNVLAALMIYFGFIVMLIIIINALSPYEEPTEEPVIIKVRTPK